MLTAPEAEPVEGVGNSSAGTTRFAFRSVLSYLAVPLSAIITGPVLARALSPGGRGDLTAVLTLPYVAVLVFGSGLGEAIVYHVGRGRTSWNTACAIGVLTGAMLGTLAAEAIVLVTPLMLGDRANLVHLARLIALLVIPLLAAYGLRAAIQAGAGFSIIIAERWTSTLLRAALIILAAIFGWLNVTSGAWLQEGSMLAATGVLVAGLFRGRIQRSVAPPQPLQRHLLSIYRFAARSWSANLTTLLVLKLDLILIVPLVGSRELGLYAVAVSLAEIPALALVGVRDVLIVRATAAQDPGFVASVARACMAALVLGATAAIVLAPWFFPLVFGSAYRDSVPMAQILLLACIPAAVSTVVSAGLTAEGRPMEVTRAQGAGLAVTVVLLFALVPWIGGRGAAIASLASYVVSAAVASRRFGEPHGLGLSDFMLPRPRDFVAIVRLVVAQLRRV